MNYPQLTKGMNSSRRSWWVGFKVGIFLFFSSNAHSSELSNRESDCVACSNHGRCASSAGGNQQIHVPQADKYVLESADKTGWMSLNWCLNRWDVYQLRLECLDGRGHNDSSWQLVPNPNCSREETIVEGIDTPNWNTELTSMSSRILSVWSHIQWYPYCDQSIDYSVHYQLS